MGSGTDDIEESLEEDRLLRERKAQAEHPDHATLNRYGDWWWWSKETENSYLFNMTGNSLSYCRVVSDLGRGAYVAFDPSGGPYVGIGTKIDGRAIVSLMPSKNSFVAEVRDERS